MTWVRLDDGFTNHPKIEPLSDRAFRLFVCGLCFAGRNLTDGALTPKAVKVIQVESKATRKHVDELHHAGLWDRAGDGYLIHDYLDKNLSREAVTELREKRAEAGRKGGLSRRKAEANGQANASANASKQKGKHRGNTPSRPTREVKSLSDEAWFERHLHKQNQQ